MLKVAMLSKWHVHAPEYARRLSEMDDVQLTCVWDEIPERGQAWAKELGTAFEPDLDKLLARDDVDAVCIDTPTNMHKDIMIKAAKAGKHRKSHVSERQGLRRSHQGRGREPCGLHHLPAAARMAQIPVHQAGD